MIIMIPLSYTVSVHHLIFSPPKLTMNLMSVDRFRFRLGFSLMSCWQLGSRGEAVFEEVYGSTVGEIGKILANPYILGQHPVKSRLVRCLKNSSKYRLWQKKLAAITYSRPRN